MCEMPIRESLINGCQYQDYAMCVDSPSIFGWTKECGHYIDPNCPFYWTAGVIMTIVVFILLTYIFYNYRKTKQLGEDEVTKLKDIFTL